MATVWCEVATAWCEVATGIWRRDSSATAHAHAHAHAHAKSLGCEPASLELRGSLWRPRALRFATIDVAAAANANAANANAANATAATAATNTTADAINMTPGLAVTVRDGLLGCRGGSRAGAVVVGAGW